MLGLRRSLRFAIGAFAIAAVFAHGASAAPPPQFVAPVLRTVTMPVRTAPFVRPKAIANLRPEAAAATLLSEPFSGTSTAPKAWFGTGGVCLTAGNGTTPATSVAACGSKAAQDATGHGALQITNAAYSQVGMIVATTPFSTAGGLQITFTDYAFDGSATGANGLTLFLADASKPRPALAGVGGAALGYANRLAGSPPALSGLAGAYLSVGLDEYGSFSDPAAALTGGPGRIPETVSVRGAAAAGWRYLGGAKNAAGRPASLPFALDRPGTTTRPATAPTVRATLLASGSLTVAIDAHDGKGFVSYFSGAVAGTSGQPAVPASVFLGFAASTGGKYQRHQIGGLTVSTLGVRGTPLADPPQLRSANGALTFNVTAQTNLATGNPQFVYNGSNVPPTLRLLPGDTLTVNLSNGLPAQKAGAQYMNDINLHYHGLHVSPQAPGDDSIDMTAAPGQSLHYTIHIPATHPPGLYWYHSHAHGETERQTLAGMSGAIVIDGIVKYSPQIANLPERILIVRDAPLPGFGLPGGGAKQIAAMNWALLHGAAVAGMGMQRSAMQSMAIRGATRNPYVATDPNYRRFVRPSDASPHCLAAQPEAPVKSFTLNGAVQPSIAIAPNEKQFWRLVNAGADTYLDVAIDGTTMNVIALDGVPLQSGVGTPASLAVTHYVLPPASRVEFTVTGPPAGTTAYLRTNCFDSGFDGNPMPATILASLVSTGSAVARGAAHERQRAANSPLRYRFAPALRRGAAMVSQRRTLYYSDQYNINGIAYDPGAAPMFYAQVGTTEEWTIQNNSAQVHTFHIHQVHFVVEAIDGVTQGQQYVMDNVDVPAATASGPGTVKLLLDFTDPTIVGTFLVHCHILSHEDAGMMAAIRIGTAPPLGLSASTVNFAHPTSPAQTVNVSGGRAPYGVSACNGIASVSLGGSTLSIKPLAPGSCLLTVSDASTPKISSNVTIDVGAAPPVITLAPATVSFVSPTAPALNVSVEGDTKPDSFAGCSGIASASVSGDTVKVQPLAVGACSLVLSDARGNKAALAVSVNAPSSGSALDNLTFHQNTARQGWYKNEQSLTTASVRSSAFGRVATIAAPAGLPAFGKVYAQPLYATNEFAADGKTHNLLVIASSTAQLYAFDERSLGVVWHRSFTNAAANVRQQLWDDTRCSDVNPNMGIIGTPVIDRALDRLFVVVATMENGTPAMRLHAVSLRSGLDVVAPRAITGSMTLASGGVVSLSPLGNMNRSALLEANGNIYVSLSSHCDQSLGGTKIHGWEIAYDAATLTETGNLVDLTNADIGSGNFLGGAWMGGYGPAADAQGNVYFATGNGAYDGTNDFAQSVLKLPGNLNMGAAKWFTPATHLADSAADMDLGSGGVMLLPDQNGSVPHLLVAGGKCSANHAGCFKYLLDRDALGGATNGGSGAVWKADTSASVFGGPAYFVDSSGKQHVLYGGNPTLNSYTLGVWPAALTVNASSSGGPLAGRDSGSQPVVSSNGTNAGTAVAWALKTPGNNGGNITLVAFDALNMGAPLFSGVAGDWTRTPGSDWIGEALVSPLVVNGRVYVPTDGSVGVFGLR